MQAQNENNHLRKTSGEKKRNQIKNWGNGSFKIKEKPFPLFRSLLHLLQTYWSSFSRKQICVQMCLSPSSLFTFLLPGSTTGNSCTNN